MFTLIVHIPLPWLLFGPHHHIKCPSFEIPYSAPLFSNHGTLSFYLAHSLCLVFCFLPFTSVYLSALTHLFPPCLSGSHIPAPAFSFPTSAWSPQPITPVALWLTLLKPLSTSTCWVKMESLIKVGIDDTLNVFYINITYPWTAFLPNSINSSSKITDICCCQIVVWNYDKNFLNSHREKRSYKTWTLSASCFPPIYLCINLYIIYYLLYYAYTHV